MAAVSLAGGRADTWRLGRNVPADVSAQMKWTPITLPESRRMQMATQARDESVSGTVSQGLPPATAGRRHLKNGCL
jgi:hypothetical protein